LYGHDLSGVEGCRRAADVITYLETLTERRGPTHRSAEMQNSIFIARLAGPVLAWVGLAILLRPQAFRGMVQSFMASPATLYLTGFLALVGSVALVLVHNLWSPDWRVIITVLGWVGVVKGAVIIVRPQSILSLGGVFLARRGAVLVTAAANFIIGLILSYFGYFS